MLGLIQGPSLNGVPHIQGGSSLSYTSTDLLTDVSRGADTPLQRLRT